MSICHPDPKTMEWLPFENSPSNNIQYTIFSGIDGFQMVCLAALIINREAQFDDVQNGRFVHGCLEFHNFYKMQI